MSTQDWKWQLRNQVRTLEQLKVHLVLTPEEIQAVASLTDRFRLGITPYYLKLMDPKDPACPIRRQAVPLMAEGTILSGESSDPLAEEANMVVPGLTRRYPNRALLYVSHSCAVYCRHCTRRRKVSDPESRLDVNVLTQAIQWIADHPEVDDVILSGGDPLSLSDARLAQLLAALRPHVRMIRLGTRHPTTLPQRITPELCKVLERYPPIYVMTHFNHPKECTPEAGRALNRLADAGCVLSNQSVLLRGVNDEAEVLSALHRWLLEHRCRPYRLYHCDFSEGVAHFRVPLSEGLEILGNLRGHTSGLAVPEYVVDLPGGLGKSPVGEGHYRQGTWTFLSYTGESVELHEDGMVFLPGTSGAKQRV
jgi:lysine 2,3-aminomutase